MRNPIRPLAALVAATALAVAGGTAAHAGDGDLHVVRTLPGSYVAPLQFAVGHRVYVADSAVSALFAVGSKKPIARGPAPSKDPEQTGDLAGVAVANGRIAYTTTDADHEDTYLTVLQHGRQVLRVNLGAYERRHNPDGGITYGATDPSALSATCRAQLKRAHLPVTYTGEKDSHAYSVVGQQDGSWLVADAGGNDVVRVGVDGTISTVAVLPAQRAVVTKAFAKEVKAPACAGAGYAFESVPTDVEVGPQGLLVTTLPGGEGAPGSVYRIAPGSSTPERIATGFAGAVNLAVTPDGRIFVAELGSGISEVVDGAPHRVLTLKGTVAVEYADGVLYASTAPAVLGGRAPGRVVVLG